MTRLAAFGICLVGFVASPAARMTDSVPVYENAAEMNALPGLHQPRSHTQNTRGSLEKRQEPRKRSPAHAREFRHRARIIPIPKPKPITIRRSSQINDQSTDDQPTHASATTRHTTERPGTHPTNAAALILAVTTSASP